MRLDVLAAVFWSTGVLAVPSLHERQVVKPFLVTEDQKKALDITQRNYLLPVNWHSSAWPSDWIPEACTQVSSRFNNWSWQVWNVTFDDCPAPFVICRHFDAQISEQTLFSVRISGFSFSRNLLC